MPELTATIEFQMSLLLFVALVLMSLLTTILPPPIIRKWVSGKEGA